MLTAIKLGGNILQVEYYKGYSGKHYVIGVECSTESDPDNPFDERQCDPYIDWRPVTTNVHSIRSEVRDISKVHRVLSVSEKDYNRLCRSIHG